MGEMAPALVQPTQGHPVQMIELRTLRLETRRFTDSTSIGLYVSRFRDGLLIGSIEYSGKKRTAQKGRQGGQESPGVLSLPGK